jgi:hypothetical protein
MLEILHHDAVAAALVPGVSVVRTRAEMIPQRLRCSLPARRDDGIVQHDITVLVPEREIVGGQYRIARLHRRKLASDFFRVNGARDRGIDTRDPHRLDAAGGG